MLGARAICAALDDTILVFKPFQQSERHLVPWLAVGGVPILMSINHLSELLVGFQPLPLQARTPVLEEASRPALALVVPELTEGLLEQVSRVQALIRRQQGFKRLSALQGQVLPMREQRVFLALDVAAI